jgi:hypothetical protein
MESETVPQGSVFFDYTAFGTHPAVGSIPGTFATLSRRRMSKKSRFLETTPIESLARARYAPIGNTSYLHIMVK